MIRWSWRVILMVFLFWFAGFAVAAESTVSCVEACANQLNRNCMRFCSACPYRHNGPCISDYAGETAECRGKCVRASQKRCLEKDEPINCESVTEYTEEKPFGNAFHACLFHCGKKCSAYCEETFYYPTRRCFESCGFYIHRHRYICKGLCRDGYFLPSADGAKVE